MYDSGTNYEYDVFRIDELQNGYQIIDCVCLVAINFSVTTKGSVWVWINVVLHCISLWAMFVIMKRRSYLLQTILSLILHQIFLTKVFLMLFHVYLIHFYQEKWKKRREMYKMSYLEKKRRGQENNYLPFVMWFLALLEVWKKDRIFNCIVL